MSSEGFCPRPFAIAVIDPWCAVAASLLGNRKGSVGSGDVFRTINVPVSCVPRPKKAADPLVTTNTEFNAELLHPTRRDNAVSLRTSLSDRWVSGAAGAGLGGWFVIVVPYVPCAADDAGNKGENQ